MDRTRSTPSLAPNPTPDGPLTAAATTDPGAEANATAASASNATASTAPASTAPEINDHDVRSAEQSSSAGEHATVMARLSPQLARIDRDAIRDERMVAHALMARSATALGNASAAERHYAKVLSLWSNPQTAAKEILGAESNERRGLSRLARALSTAGEALFFNAEKKRRRAEGLKPPPFRGAHTQAAIERYIQTGVRDWMREKTARVAEAEKAYSEVIGLLPVPPPRWVASSAAAVAQMLVAFAVDFESVPVPPRIQKDPALRRVYRDALRAATEPLRARAKAALRACQAYSQKYQYSDALTEKCTTDLTRLDAPTP